MKAQTRNSFLIFCLIGWIGFAGVQVHANTALKETMETIGRLFKEVGKTATDSSKNSQNVQNAGQIGRLFQQSKTMMPDSIAALPADQQPQAMAEYRSALDEMTKDSQDLAQAFFTNNNSLATQILKHMSEDRKEYHRRFDP